MLAMTFEHIDQRQVESFLFLSVFNYQGIHQKEKVKDPTSLLGIPPPIPLLEAPLFITWYKSFRASFYDIQ